MQNIVRKIKMNFVCSKTETKLHAQILNNPTTGKIVQIISCFYRAERNPPLLKISTYKTT